MTTSPVPTVRHRRLLVARLVALLAADAVRGEQAEQPPAPLAPPNASGPTGCTGRTTATGREHQRAVRIKSLMEQLGPFYVKVGQILATRTDIVSAPLAAELAGLHRSVTAAPFETFTPVLDADLGPHWHRDLHGLHRAAPVGSASLAQVYRAGTADGGTAIVKIQRPDAAALVNADLADLRRAARLAGRCLPRLDAVLDIEATLDAVFDAMRPELDFRLEADNMDQARHAAAGFDLIDVPTVTRATRRVLIQSTAPGVVIGSPRAALLPARLRARIGTQLLTFMYRGYFRDRTFHADPHPGNILVHDTGATVIDWGMVGRLDRGLSSHGLFILTSLAQNDAAGLADAWIAAGRRTPWADVQAFHDDMARLVPRISAACLQHLDFGTALTTLLRHSARRGIRANPMIGLLGKSFANIEGSVRAIAPELSITEVFREALADTVADLAGELAAPEQALRTALELMAVWTSAPGQLRTLLNDVSGHDATVRVGLLPGHGIGGEGAGTLARFRPQLLAAAAGVWLLRRESRHLMERWHEIRR
ncbi:MAG: AarF/ABC1/UbiB kinase family protein [Catenulispora sp.]|nr:AarF/ABC1/UbiB kinase family protein [Catenulispora sp.]